MYTAGPRTPDPQRRRRTYTTGERSIPPDTGHRREADCTREARRRNSGARRARRSCMRARRTARTRRFHRRRRSHRDHRPHRPRPSCRPRRRCTSGRIRPLQRPTFELALSHADADATMARNAIWAGALIMTKPLSQFGGSQDAVAGAQSPEVNPKIATRIARIAHRIIAALNRARRRRRSRRRVRAGSTAAAGLAEATARGRVRLAHAGLTGRCRRRRQGNARPVIGAVSPVVAATSRVARRALGFERSKSLLLRRPDTDPRQAAAAVGRVMNGDAVAIGRARAIERGHLHACG